MKEILKKFFMKYKFQFIFIIIGTTLCNILSLSYLYIYKHIINGLVEDLNISVVLKWTLILFVILIINTFLSFYVYSFYFRVFKTKLANDFRLTMFKNMIFSFQNHFIEIFNKDLNSWFLKEKKIILWNGLNDILKNFIFSFMPKKYFSLQNKNINVF